MLPHSTIGLPLLKKDWKPLLWMMSLKLSNGAEDDVDTVSLFDVEKSLVDILKKWSDTHERVAIADKWKGGKLILEPGDNLANKEMPIATFFHKIVMVRDRLRVMEQKINSSKNLDDQER